MLKVQIQGGVWLANSFKFKTEHSLELVAYLTIFEIGFNIWLSKTQLMNLNFLISSAYFFLQFNL